MRQTERFLTAAFIVAVFLQAALVLTFKPQVDSQKARKDSPAMELSLDKEALQKRIEQDPVLKNKLSIAFWIAGLFLFTVGFQFIRLTVRAFWGEPLTESLGAPEPPAWGFGEIFRLLLLALVVLQWTAILEWICMRLLHWPAWFDRHVASLMNTILIDGMVVWMAWRLMRRANLNLLGGWEKMKQGVGLAFRFYIGCVPLYFTALILIGAIFRRLGYEPQPQAVLTMYLTEQRAPVLVWLLFLAAFFGPVVEEIFFRGILYGWMRLRFGIGRGLILSSLLFAMLHTDVTAFLPILGLGVIFGWVYERTGTLAAPIAVHVFHNAVMISVAWVIKQVVVP